MIGGSITAGLEDMRHKLHQQMNPSTKMTDDNNTTHTHTATAPPTEDDIQ